MFPDHDDYIRTLNEIPIRNGKMLVSSFLLFI